MLPRLTIIGAMKRGTTGLYRYLAAQEGVVASRKKETDFFLTPTSIAQGLSWYEDQFSAPGQWAFESSPNYSKRHLFPGVPERIAQVVPDAHLVYILRDPVKRAISHYVHSVSRGRECRSLAEALLEPGSNYLQTSMYHYQLMAFINYFPPGQLTLIDFTDIVADPGASTGALMARFGASALTDESVLSRRFNDSAEKMQPSSLEANLKRAIDDRRVNALLRRVLRPLRKPNGSLKLTDTENEQLWGLLNEDAEALRGFTRCEFASWSV